MDTEALLDAARTQTGLSDLGVDSYREGLDRYVWSVTEEARLNDLGMAAIEAQVTSNLANRLRVTEWISRNPSVLDRPVERPLIVLGLPRTGTTLLSELFHRDPRNRSLMRWEAQDPVPPPDGAHLDDDPRIETARASAEMMEQLNPGFGAIHYEAPDGPTECVALLSQDFKSLLWECVANVPSYGEWLLTCNQSSAYEHHRRVLQLLQSNAPGRWALKTPHHCLALDAVVERYPDARLVMTHRDPVTVVASLCSLIRSLTGTFTDADHGEYINAHWPAVAGTIVDRVMAWRGEHGDDRFHDVAYDALVADPVGTVRGIYEHFGDELGPDAEAAMRTYAAENPQGVRGRHSYGLEELGLDRGALEERFAGYRSHFGIPRDALH